MYAQEMSRIEALPYCAAETALIALSPLTGTTGWVGRKGARCSATQMGLRDYEMQR